MNEIIKIIISAAIGGLIALIGRQLAGRGNVNSRDSARVESDLQRTADRLDSAGSRLGDISAGVERVQAGVESAEKGLADAAAGVERIHKGSDRVEELLAELTRRAAEDDL